MELTTQLLEKAAMFAIDTSEVYDAFARLVPSSCAHAGVESWSIHLGSLGGLLSEVRGDVSGSSGSSGVRVF